MRLRIAGVGPQLLLLHGPQTQAMWHAVAERLSGEFTIVASDLPGYGGSAPTASCSNREMAAALVEVMADLGFERRPMERGGQGMGMPLPRLALHRRGRASPGPRHNGSRASRLTEPGAGS